MLHANTRMDKYIGMAKLISGSKFFQMTYKTEQNVVEK
jgi:hypothetical protein